MSKPNPKAGALLGGALVATFAIFSFIKSSTIPNPARALTSGSILLAWMAFGLLWFFGRSSRAGVSAVAILFLFTASWVGYEYLHDIPRRRQVAEIKQLGEVSVVTSGEIWTGEIFYLRFDSNISEEQVLDILHSPGLEHLERIVFKQTPITDITLAKLAQLPTLRDVYVEGGEVSEAAVTQLRNILPRCKLEVR